MKMTTKPTLAKKTAAAACLLLAVGVLLGAFGAHGLKNITSPKALELWSTATLYLLIHGLGVLCLSALLEKGWINLRPVLCLMIGVMFFSGSLYGLALGLPRAFGMITPIGGVFFVIGWGYTAIQLLSKKPAAMPH
ncbi:MAG: DUF423 domain-containing protein [Moraxella sp.]|nr:DUF423 domain-containing protein [Moraxella sp.]